ncbi:hypothetical protein DZ860_15805 [Vibrio sinensis]|uniref:Uncharacterized protein n=1 Tax=Vibrio sinensis TaxID=2302434 RepID=A0A3A6QFJ5_9VIBR|nr:hypothetical protein DZ860_15805 [Vibrio sinensis]
MISLYAIPSRSTKTNILAAWQTVVQLKSQVIAIKRCNSVYATEGRCFEGAIYPPIGNAYKRYDIRWFKRYHLLLIK